MQTFLNCPTFYRGGCNSHSYYGESNIIQVFNYLVKRKNPEKPFQPKWKDLYEYSIDAQCYRLSSYQLTLQTSRNYQTLQHCDQRILNEVISNSIQVLTGAIIYKEIYCSRILPRMYHSLKIKF